MDKIIYLTNTDKPNSLPKVTLCGHVLVKGRNEHFRRLNNEWIMYLVEQGKMLIVEDDITYTLVPGDVIIFSPGRTHWGIESDNDVGYFYVHFNWDGLKETLHTEEEYIFKINTAINESLHKVEDYFIGPKYSHLTPANYTQMIEVVNHMLVESKNRYMNYSTFINSLFHIMLVIVHRSNFERYRNSQQQYSFIPEILLYLRSHLSEKITSEILENEINLSFDYMNRTFRKHTGMTIFKHLQKIRLEESKKLLRGSQLSISEIAENTGFCNAYYFSSVFRKVENITPSRYRNKSR
ncbi:MAG: AraC family transcriptional regulator [Lachnospiraceae bacterium]|nr:AraC family transcriptional regulator [Lachnospiraceae bacterium]